MSTLTKKFSAIALIITTGISSAGCGTRQDPPPRILPPTKNSGEGESIHMVDPRKLGELSCDVQTDILVCSTDKVPGVYSVMDHDRNPVQDIVIDIPEKNIHVRTSDATTRQETRDTTTCKGLGDLYVCTDTNSAGTFVIFDNESHRLTGSVKISADKSSYTNCNDLLETKAKDSRYFNNNCVKGLRR